MLLETALSDERDWRADHDFQIEGNVQPRDVLDIDTDVFVHRSTFAACRNLPEPRQARFDHVAGVFPIFVVRDNLGKLRPRADDAHIATYDVPELGELIEAPLAQESADARKPRIDRALVGLAAVVADEGDGVLKLQRFRLGDVRLESLLVEIPTVVAASAPIMVHRAKFIDLESAPVATDPLLGEKDRAAEVDAYRDHAHSHDGKYQYQDRARDDAVDRGLDDADVHAVWSTHDVERSQLRSIRALCG